MHAVAHHRRTPEAGEQQGAHRQATFVLTVREMSASGVISAVGLKCPPLAGLKRE